MPLEQIILLAVVQGLTEFLPISSSSHLILTSYFFGFDDQGTLVDVAVHGGTLLAVVAYFRKDLLNLLRDVFPWLQKVKPADPDKRAWFHREGYIVLMATFPVALVGAGLYYSGYLTMVRNVEIIAWSNIIFALLLYFSDRWSFSSPLPDGSKVGMKKALLIGAAQVLALIPGTSRAGVTITMARSLGYKRFDAARFSMLLSIPVISLFVLGDIVLLVQGESVSFFYMDALLLVFITAAVAFLTLGVFMRLVARFSLTPFVLYRIILSVGLLLFIRL